MGIHRTCQSSDTDLSHHKTQQQLKLIWRRNNIESCCDWPRALLCVWSLSPWVSVIIRSKMRGDHHPIIRWYPSGLGRLHDSYSVKSVIKGNGTCASILNVRQGQLPSQPSHHLNEAPLLCTPFIYEHVKSIADTKCHINCQNSEFPWKGNDQTTLCCHIELVTTLMPVTLHLDTD